MYALSLLAHFSELAQVLDEVEQQETPETAGVIAASAAAYATCSRKSGSAVEYEAVARVLKVLVPARVAALRSSLTERDGETRGGELEGKEGRGTIQASDVTFVEPSVPSPATLAVVAENCAFSIAVTLMEPTSYSTTSTTSPTMSRAYPNLSPRMYSPRHCGGSGVRTVVRDLTSSLDSLVDSSHSVIPRAAIPAKVPREAVDVVATLVPVASALSN